MSKRSREFQKAKEYQTENAIAERELREGRVALRHTNRIHRQNFDEGIRVLRAAILKQYPEFSAIEVDHEVRYELRKAQESHENIAIPIDGI